MLTHHSSRIQNAIQREIFKASKSVKIAVAWFTNDLLFSPLLLKLASGVSVEIILNDDDINRRGENSLDFSEFLKQGGVLRWNSSTRLMHDKFCIIDDKVVIFGSYNWTHKAEFNEESISIAENEIGTLDFYNKKFKRLQDTFKAEEVIKTQQAKSQRSSLLDSLLDAEPVSELDPVRKILSQWYNPEVEAGYEVEVGVKFGPAIKSYRMNVKGLRGLRFYDHLKVTNDDDGHQFVFAYKWLKNNIYQYSILDEQTWMPVRDMSFDDYKIIKTNSHGYIWLKFGNKWALFNPELNRFGSPAVYKDIPNTFN